MLYFLSGGRGRGQSLLPMNTHSSLAWGAATPFVVTFFRTVMLPEESHWTYEHKTDADWEGTCFSGTQQSPVYTVSNKVNTSEIRTFQNCQNFWKWTSENFLKRLKIGRTIYIKPSDRTLVQPCPAQRSP